MEYLYLLMFAAGSYLISGINPAIILSKCVYKQDIRQCGSKNPGFTNFKRTYGMKLAWLVMILDLLKSIVPALCAGIIMGKLYNMYQLGVTVACFFSMLGHAYPIWYGFKGGKGFLVCQGAMWILDWRVGLVSTLIMIVLLIVTKYMSLSTMLAMMSCPFVLAIVGIEHILALVFCIMSVAFMVYRHKANIVRLYKGTESKFYFGKKHIG